MDEAKIKEAFQQTISYWNAMQKFLEDNLGVKIEVSSLYIGVARLQLINGIEIKHGSDYCELCLKTTSCRECPIYGDTHKAGCHNTPYYDWTKVIALGGKIIFQEHIDTHKKEVDYLEDLYKRRYQNG